MAHASEDFSFYDKARETRDPAQRQRDLTRDFLRTLRYAYDHSITYRQMYDGAGIDLSAVRDSDDMERLPLLRMTDLVERQRQVFPFGGFEILGNRPLHRVYVNSGLLFQPGGDWESEDTSWAQALCAAGFKPGDRIMNTFNYHLWPFARVMEESARKIGTTVVPAGGGNTMMQVKIMQMLEVNGFLGTPSFLTTLVQRAEGMGLDLAKDLFLETALVSAEMLPESLRTRLQEKLSMTVRQAYGTVFLGCIGFECHAMTGLHVPEGILVEIVDPSTGKKVPPGAVGEIVATCFSPSYPMIRMATGDLSCLSEQKCACGRTGLLLKKIIGRLDQATKVKGIFIHPWQTDEVMSRYPEVIKYQIVISRKNHLDVMTLLAEVKEGLLETVSLQRRMEHELEEMLGVRTSVQVVSRGTLPDRHRKIEDQRKWD